MHSPVQIVLLAAGLLGGGAALAEKQGPSEQGVPPDTFVLEPGGHSAISLIERSAEFLGRNYLFHEQELAGAADVSLQTRLELDESGTEEVVSQLLYSLGLIMLPSDPERGIYEWINMQGPRRGEITARATTLSPRQVLARRRLKVPVMCTVAVQHTNAQIAAQTLRPFFSQGGSNMLTVGASTQTSVMLGGLADQVANAIELLQQIDEAAAEAEAIQEKRDRLDAEKRLDRIETLLEIRKETATTQQRR